MAQQLGPKNNETEIQDLIQSARKQINTIKDRVNGAYNIEINTLERALLTFELCVQENARIHNEVALIFMRGRLIFDTDIWGEFSDELKEKYADMLMILINLHLVDSNIMDYFRNRIIK